jgi:hypothetical protein
MNQEKHFKEKIALIEKELATITDLADELSAALKDLEDLKLELKGLKVFLGRCILSSKASSRRYSARSSTRETCLPSPLQRTFYPHNQGIIPS